jgi:hypothetical protein
LRRGFVVRKSGDGGELCVALVKRVRLGERDKRGMVTQSSQREEHREHREEKGAVIAGRR